MPPFLLLFIGVLFCSTSLIFIKQSELNPILLAGYRQIFAALILSPLFIRAWRRHKHKLEGFRLRSTILPGILLGVHFSSWIYGGRMTDAGNASLLINFTPVVMPFFLYFTIKEVIRTGEIIGTLIALLGIGLLIISDYAFKPENVPGDLVCISSMLLFAWYLVFARKNKNVPDLWLYVAPLYFVAGIVCFVIAAAWPGVDVLQAVPKKQLGYALGLAFFPTVIGHSLLNYSMQKLRGQIVSLCNLGQFIFATIYGVLLFEEIPRVLFYPAAMLIVGGCVFVIRSSAGSDRKRGRSRH